MNKKNKLFQELVKKSSQPNKTIDWMIDNFQNEWEPIKFNFSSNNKNEACLCGTKIKYICFLKNKINNNIVQCGKKCFSELLGLDAKKYNNILELLCKLRENNNKYIKEWKKCFSKDFLLFLYINNYFDGYDEKNGNRRTPKEEYEFLLKMFNKKNEPTENQNKKINAIVFVNILKKLKNNNYEVDQSEFKKFFKYSKK